MQRCVGLAHGYLEPLVQEVLGTREGSEQGWTVQTHSSSVELWARPEVRMLCLSLWSGHSAAGDRNSKLKMKCIASPNQKHRSGPFQTQLDPGVQASSFTCFSLSLDWHQFQAGAAADKCCAHSSALPGRKHPIQNSSLCPGRVLTASNQAQVRHPSPTTGAEEGTP